MRYSLVSLIVFASPLACLAQPPANAQGHLSLADDKAVYKIGEPILLRLTFSATARMSLNMTTTDPASPIDRLVVAPMSGVFPWLDDQDRGHPYVPDYALMETIDSGKSQTVELPLNAVYRFDAPGRYSVYVVTKRIETAALTTNTVSFEIQPLTDAEEASRALDLEQKIRQASTLPIARKYAEQLDWLTGDPSTRVKLSLLFHPKTFYPFAVDITEGLWIARNRAYVVDQLEKVLKDPAQELPGASPLLRTAVDLRARLDNTVDRTQEVEAAYLKQIVASLPQRAGNSLVTAAQTAFMRMAAMKDVSSPEFAAARDVVITHFSEVNEYNVDWLLNSFGTYLRDRRLVPALKQILANQKDPILGGERTAVIRQLVKIAPQDSRAEVVSEVCGDNATFNEIVGELPFSSLPETDACLWRKIDAALTDRNPMPLQWSTFLAARLASPALSDELFELYRQNGTAWNGETRGYVLAYLVRWNPQRGQPLLESALPRTASSPDPGLTYALGRVGYIPALDTFWRERLLASPPELAAQSAYQMSENGPAEDQALLQARLSDWRAHWKGQEIPPAEARFEAELTQAVMHGAHWQLPQDDTRSLASNCLSETCRTRFASLSGPAPPHR